MPTLVADVADRQHGSRAQGVLNADAVLVTGREIVIIHSQAGDDSGVDGPSRRRACIESQARVGHFHSVEAALQAVRNVGTGVVHIVALDAFVHDTESATKDSLAATRQIIGKAEAGTEGGTVIIVEALRNAILTGNADAIKVERNAGENRVGAGAETGASRRATGVAGTAADRIVAVKSCCQRRIVQ